MRTQITIENANVIQKTLGKHIKSKKGKTILKFLDKLTDNMILQYRHTKK